jgi:group I intron endonuclease
MILNIDQLDKVLGEIYKITNTVTNKCYVGQTRSHRLNHKKYRPFGYLGRFKDHINEAYSSKKNISRYLNYSILKYGESNFVCEKILECPISELDEYEKKYILELNTKYPNGYNLTDGGKGFGVKPNIENDVVIPNRNVGSKRKDSTKKLISSALKDALKPTSKREEMMKIVQSQHTSKKFER